MLKYQIHKLSKGGKEARAVLLEDILTSDVFGLMAYFPYDLLLKPFLEKVSLKNPRSQFSVPDLEPVDFHFWKSFHWPESLPHLDRESIEPDVVIEWPDLVLIVEAKFVSSTDSEELLREYLVGANQASSDQSFFLLLIDKNLSPAGVSYQREVTKVEIPKYIENRILDLECTSSFPTSEVASTFLWTNWQSFYELVEDLLLNEVNRESAGISKTDKNILMDLQQVLERKGLLPFEALSLEDFEKYEVSLDRLRQVGQMLQDPFHILWATLATVVCAPLAVWVADRVGERSTNLLYGLGRETFQPHERLAGELDKIRYSKREGEFDRALNLVNQLLNKAPDLPEALFLKAQILWEGFGYREAAEGYLKKVLGLVRVDEPLHRWALGYHEQIIGMKHDL